MKTQHLIILVGLAIAGLLSFAFIKSADEAKAPVLTEDTLNSFASCLSDAGAKFYGAFWCPHCQDQKALFENASNLPYVECSTPDGQEQLEVCTNENITSYPTWRFTDGSELKGVQSLEALGEKTSCTIAS